MKHTLSEQSTDNTNANDDQQNKETYSGDTKSLGGREELEGTPYYIVWTDKEWFITFNKYRITKLYKLDASETMGPHQQRVDEVLVKELHWIIMRVAGCMHEAIAQAAINEAQQS